MADERLAASIFFLLLHHFAQLECEFKKKKTHAGNSFLTLAKPDRTKHTKKTLQLMDLHVGIWVG